MWEQDECKYCTPTGVEIKERHRTTRCSHQVSSCNVVNTSIFKYKSKTCLIKIKIHLNSQKENKYLGFCFFASPENSVHEPRVLPRTGPNSSGDFVPALGGHGMVVRLDIFHWIHRFDAAIRTDSHSKYAAFKSALAGAVLAYNRGDLELLIKGVRARDPARLGSLSDEDVVRSHMSRDQMRHHVRRLTIGPQETFRLIHQAIEELKGPAGLDESGVSLFKSPGMKHLIKKFTQHRYG